MVTGLGEKAEFRSGRASNAPVRHLNFILQVKCVSNFSYFSKNSSKFYGGFFGHVFIPPVLLTFT